MIAVKFNKTEQMDVRNDYLPDLTKYYNGFKKDDESDKKRLTDFIIKVLTKAADGEKNFKDDIALYQSAAAFILDESKREKTHNRQIDVITSIAKKIDNGNVTKINAHDVATSLNKASEFDSRGAYLREASRSLRFELGDDCGDIYTLNGISIKGEN
jgi:hypothetical protein